MDTIFKEEQKFTQWWLWVILIGIGLLPFYGIYRQLIVGENFGSNPMPDVVLLFFATFTLSLLLLFWKMRLITEIDNSEIRFSFWPFMNKKVRWDEIESAKIINYGFVGYGIRLWTKYGTVYNTKGQIGLYIQLTNGNKFIIGTQREDELNRIVGLKISKNRSE